MSTTDEVFQEDIFKIDRRSHPSNIDSIFLTEEVSKLERSSEVSLLQLKNILDMLVTEEVLKLERSMEVSSPQLENI